ncbi:flagellar protein FlgN [Radiobacillus kanasensis]|uniref:flagellar protein FlgN n=1 Tax=Radiobacillus kanasensis TaxID=2844358 RepID=UPI001E4A2242|nr:flagellar protein FlgN [Radiobacillus kanasensis]UFT98550.1 flagellar protein FlgN [Radiobacillus kanasensis]
MTVQAIIESLSKLKQLHESLLSVSLQKTDAVKDGKTKALQSLLIQERKHVQAIEQVEAKRVSQTEAWAKKQGFPAEDVTVSFVMEHLEEGSEKEQMEQVTFVLASVLVKLKQQEHLNQDLIQQSLQFINLTLDMVQPTVKNINYGNNANKQPEQTARRSAFDSKA